MKNKGFLTNILLLVFILFFYAKPSRSFEWTNALRSNPSTVHITILGQEALLHRPLVHEMMVFLKHVFNKDCHITAEFKLNALDILETKVIFHEDLEENLNLIQYFKNSQTEPSSIPVMLVHEQRGEKAYGLSFAPYYRIKNNLSPNAEFIKKNMPLPSIFLALDDIEQDLTQEQAQKILAHELLHILLNKANHNLDANNLLANGTEPGQEISEEQCKQITKSPYLVKTSNFK